MRTIQKHSSTSFWFRLIVVFSFFYYVPFRLFCPCPSPASLFPVVDCCVVLQFAFVRMFPRQTALQLTAEFTRECRRGRMHGGGRRASEGSGGRSEIVGLFGGSHPLRCCRWLVGCCIFDWQGVAAVSSAKVSPKRVCLSGAAGLWPWRLRSGDRSARCLPAMIQRERGSSKEKIKVGENRAVWIPVPMCPAKAGN